MASRMKTRGNSAEECKRRGLKVKADKLKVMVLNGEEGLECEVHVDRFQVIERIYRVMETEESVDLKGG